MVRNIRQIYTISGPSKQKNPEKAKLTKHVSSFLFHQNKMHNISSDGKLTNNVTQAKINSVKK